MEDKSIILDPVKTIISITEKLEKKEKFAFVNISRSAILSSIGNTPNDKKPPKYFLKSIAKCFAIENPNFMRALPNDFSKDLETGKLETIGLKKELDYYDASVFDHFYFNRKDVLDVFINYYIKNTKNVILSFHDKKTVQKAFGQNHYIINVSYNDFYEKIDSIYSQVEEFEEGCDYLLMDCPLLATAIAPKVWENSTLSVIDFGKIVSSSRYSNKVNDKKQQG